MERTIKRCARHRGAGLGWLYVKPVQESGMYSGCGPEASDDPHQSGQRPEFTACAWERLKAYTADPFYADQIATRLAELDKQLQIADGAVNSSIADLMRLREERDKVAGLLPDDDITEVTSEL